MAKQTVTADPKAIQEPDLQGALEDLKTLVQKPKKIPPEKVVMQGLDLIQTALDQGYNFTEIARVFGKRGVKISTKELKQQYELALAGKQAVNVNVNANVNEDEEEEEEGEYEEDEEE